MQCIRGDLFIVARRDWMATVLIVDDSEYMRNQLSDVVANEHEVVGTATNGREGVRMAGTHSPDIVVMDVVMPVMDGITAVERIGETNPDTSFVMCTSVEQTVKRRQAVAAGADAYLTKPCGKAEVLKTISDVLGGSSGGE
jgi:two-component system chemotaxis response regulator CheY